jgi:hypothetical protein
MSVLITTSVTHKVDLPSKRRFKLEETSAIIFMACCMFLPMILLHFSIDRVVIQKEIRYVYIDKPSNITKQAKQVKQANKNDQLIDDAIQCLVSLGMKKPIAKAKVNDMFNIKNYESIESFLIDAYKI